MIKLRVKDIVKYCGGKLICGNLEDEICGFSKDTRSINKGETYVGIKGEKFDGNSYYDIAIKSGADTCIIEKHYEKSLDLNIVKNKNIIIVDNGIKALQDIAKYVRNKSNMPVVAITRKRWENQYKGYNIKCFITEI